jgi:drug/metabolite transporter (DMT)-like permease
MISFFIAARIIINPVVNLCQKRLSSRGVSSMVLVCATYLACACASLPALFFIDSAALTGDFWINCGCMTLAGTAGNVLLILALRHSDLSVFGPINSFKPVAGLLIAFFLIGEAPGTRGIVGTLVIIAGSFLLGKPNEGGLSRGSIVALFKTKGVILRFASLLLISVEAVFMKRSIILAGEMPTFVFWALCGAPILMMLCGIMARGRIVRSVRVMAADPRASVASILLYGVMQYATLIVFAHMIVGFSLALFQLSSVLSVILGYFAFGERSFAYRLAGSLVMCAGAVLVIWR